MSFQLNPETVKRIRRFREIKRGYYSFIFLSALMVVSLFGPLLVLLQESRDKCANLLSLPVDGLSFRIFPGLDKLPRTSTHQI